MLRGSLASSAIRATLTLLGATAWCAFGVTGLSAQERITRVKSAPQDYRERVIRLEGEAVEVRGRTPISRYGLYRLVDASDPSGVLIRSSRLPESSGPYRVRARLSPELLTGGSLLLDEIDRSELSRSRALLPLLIAGLGLAASLLLLRQYLRARQAERHLHLGPPMWLIPTADQPGEGPGTAHSGGPVGPATRFSYHLQFVERERSVALERRRRRLARSLAGSGIVTLAGLGWYGMSRSEAAGRPSFVLLPPENAQFADTAIPQPTAGFPPPPTVPLPPGRVPAATSPLARQAEAPPPAQLPIRVQADSARREQPRVVVVPPAAESVRRRPAGAPDTLERPPAPVLRPPTPALPPPPAAPPPRPQPAAPGAGARDTTRPTPPQPDPAAVRAAAAAALQQGAERAVAAMNRADLAELRALYAAGGNAGWRDRLLGHIRDYRPTAILENLEPPVLTEAGAETAFTVGFRWRGNFGVYRTRSVRFAGAARGEGTRWVGVGIRLLEPFP